MSPSAIHPRVWMTAPDQHVRDPDQRAVESSLRQGTLDVDQRRKKLVSLVAQVLDERGSARAGRTCYSHQLKDVRIAYRDERRSLDVQNLRRH